MTLVAEAREYEFKGTSFDPDAEIQRDGWLYLDSPGGSDHPHTLAVILGVKKGTRPVGDRMHYLLVVKATKSFDRDASKVYERVGVGYLPGRALAQSGMKVTIC